MKLKLKISAFLIFICLLTLTVKKSVASHATAMELEYRHVSGSTYEYTLYFYRNCFGIPAPITLSLNIASVSKGLVGATFTMTRLGSGTSFSTSLNRCTSVPVCYEEYVYRTTVDLGTVGLGPNPTASDWVFSVEECCYPLFTNLNGGLIRAECGLDNTNIAVNDAPFWHQSRPNRTGHLLDTIIDYPIKAMCEDRQILLDQGVVEYEGHQLKYEFINPISGGGVLLTYKTGYDLANPLTFKTPPGFEIDSLTGKINFIPDAPISGGVEDYLIAIKVTESAWDTTIIGGVTTITLVDVGYVIRNLLIRVDPASVCVNNALEPKDTAKSVSCSEIKINIEMEENFLCHTADANGSFLELTDVVSAGSIGIDSVKINQCITSQGGADDFDIYLNKRLAPGDYYLTFKKGTDGNTLITECSDIVEEYADTILITVDTTPLVNMLGSKDAAGIPQSYIAAQCGQPSLGVLFDGQLLCSSVDTFGTDFLLVDSTISPPIVNGITRARAQNCIDGLSDSVMIDFVTPLKSGTYGLFLKQGNDLNTVLNSCSDPSNPSSIQIRVPEVSVELGPNIQYLTSGVLLLEAQEGYHYNWSNGDTVRQVVVTEKGQYFVIVSNDFGCTASDTVNVFDTTTSIKEVSLSEIKIFPNPSNGLVYLSNEGFSKTVNIRIIDMKGNEVYESNLLLNAKSRNKVDLTEQAKGIYFLSIFENRTLIKSERIVLE